MADSVLRVPRNSVYLVTLFLVMASILMAVAPAVITSIVTFCSTESANDGAI